MNHEHAPEGGMALLDRAARIDVPPGDRAAVRRRIGQVRRRRAIARGGVVALVVAVAVAAVGVARSWDTDVEPEGVATGPMVGSTQPSPISTIEAGSVTLPTPPRDEWSSEPLLTPRGGSSSVALADGTVLTIGGADETTGEVFRDSQIFDPATLAYTAGPSLPEGRWMAQAVIVDDAIVLVGGYSSVSGDVGDILRLHEESGTWSPGEAPPEVRDGRATVAADGRLIVVGSDGTAASWTDQTWSELPSIGSDLAGPESVMAAPDGTVVVFDRAASGAMSLFALSPGTSRWDALPAPMATEDWTGTGSQASTAIVDNELVMWGHAEQETADGPRAAVALLDLGTQTWADLDSLPARDVPDLWSHVVAGERIITWQVGEPAAVITSSRSAAIPTVPVAGTPVDAVALSSTRLVRIDPGRPESDPVLPAGTPPLYEVIDL